MERKSSLELCLDCGIQEYFTLSDPRANTCWILTPCLDKVWAHHPKSHRQLKLSWESEGKVRLELLVLMQPTTYFFSEGEHLAIWLRKFLQILNLKTSLFHIISVQCNNSIKPNPTESKRAQVTSLGVIQRAWSCDFFCCCSLLSQLQSVCYINCQHQSLVLIVKTANWGGCLYICLLPPFNCWTRITSLTHI